jgi:TDG/mug DNA glycosylase family protein
VRASELAVHEFHQAAAARERKLLHYRQCSLAFLGKPAFAAIFRQRRVDWGPQAVRFGGAKTWVLPNPIGLNRAFNLDALVSSYRKLRIASSLPQTGGKS